MSKSNRNDPMLDATYSLKSDFRETYKKLLLLKNLSLPDRLLLLDELSFCLDTFYVHLDLKREQTAYNPIQALINIRAYHLEIYDYDFHRYILRAMRRFDDIHTMYFLPHPYDKYAAALPFSVKSYYDNQKKVDRFIITNEKYNEYCQGLAKASFISDYITAKSCEWPQIGDEILEWQGAPIEDVVRRLASFQVGANYNADYRLACNFLSSRWLGMVEFPDEDYITLKFKSNNRNIRTCSIPWFIVKSQSFAAFQVETQLQSYLFPNQGLNLQLNVANILSSSSDIQHKSPETKAKLPKEGSLLTAEGPSSEVVELEDAASPINVTPDLDYDYLKIEDFDTNIFNQDIYQYECIECRVRNERFFKILPSWQLDDYVVKAKYIYYWLQKLQKLQSPKGQFLILDLRSNPGGNILFAESFMWAIAQSSSSISPMHFSSRFNPILVNSLLAEQTNSDNLALLKEFQNILESLTDLTDCLDSTKLVESGRSISFKNSTGIISRIERSNYLCQTLIRDFSQAIKSSFSCSSPLTNINKKLLDCIFREKHTGLGLKAYGKPVVVIVDGLTYSAAEMLAAGIQDNCLGQVLGIISHEYDTGGTGGGGANTWHYNNFKDFFPTHFTNFENGFVPEYRIAFRRCERKSSDPNTASLLEGRGVKPDETYLYSKCDLMDSDSSPLPGPLVERCRNMFKEMLKSEVCSNFNPG
jgi:C-terminal processing protease CtpA/Prc